MRAMTLDIKGFVQVLACGVMISVVFLSVGCREGKGLAKEKPGVDTLVAEIAEVAESAGPRVDSVNARVRSGETLERILSNLDVTDGETGALLAELKRTFKAHIYPGQRYQGVFQAHESGFRIARFQIESRDSRVLWQWSRNEGDSAVSFTYSMDSLPLHMDTVVVTATLETSLYDAVLARGESPALVNRLVHLFAWDIDFFRDPRVGDTFQVVIERQYDHRYRLRGYGDLLAARYNNQGRDHWGVRHGDGYYDLEGKSLEKMLLKAPLNYSRVSSGFSRARFHPILKKYRPHWGIDYAAPSGTPVVSAGSGKIEYAKWVGGYGKTIKVRHNSSYSTYYAHLKGYARGIGVGTRVTQGQTIGYVGSSGLSTGPHLDYRVEEHGSYINPAQLKSEPKEGISDSEREDFLATSSYYRTMLESVIQDSKLAKQANDSLNVSMGG